jgi:AcrR family transcriptional regulator
MDNDIRTQILTTAASQFLKYGVRSVTIEDVCSELHISKKTFYNYFRQKEELIDNVLKLHCDKNSGENEEVSAFLKDPSLNAIDKLVLVFTHWKRENEQEYITFFYELVKYYPEIYRKMQITTDEQALKQIKQWVEQGIAEGLVRDDVNIDLLTHYMNIQLRKTLSDVVGKVNVDIRKTMEFLLDCCIRVVVSEKGYGYYREKYQHNYPKLVWGKQSPKSAKKRLSDREKK